MTRQALLLTLSLVALLGMTSCEQNDEVACTAEFVTIAITVNGDALDDYYTIREDTGDTLRIGRENVWGENVYPVLDDSYHAMLRNRTEPFRFQGVVAGAVVVDEPFVIKADECHVIYVSGKQEVDL